MQRFYTAREIYEQRLFYWVNSYKTVLKYMDEYEGILMPVIKGKASGKRYFISDTNVKVFIKKFESSKL